jgi:hypothetical protein
MAAKKKSGKRLSPKGFNKYATAMKLTKGRSCDRKAVLRAVKRGATPSEAVARHCGR